MAFQALRRAAGKSARLGALRYLAGQQLRNGTVGSAWRFSPSVMNPAAETGVPQWGIGLRMASTAREAGRDGDSGLISVLRMELDHERKSYSQSKEVARGPPKPWQLTERQGHADVILRRSYGQEDIAVTCVYQPDEYDEQGEGNEDDFDSGDEGDADQGSCVSMNITINKGADNPTLEISAASYGSQISIEHVFFSEANESKESVYGGPNYLQLDEELKNQFEKYLRARGINRDLVGYLFSTLADKEQREYMRWLQKVESFIRQ